MKKICIVLGVISAVLAVIFSVLPLSNLAFIPAILAFVFGLIVLYYSRKQGQSKKMVQYIFLLTFIAIAIATYKTIFSVSEINNIEAFEEKENESVEETIEELEELNLEDINIEE